MTSSGGLQPPDYCNVAATQCWQSLAPLPICSQTFGTKTQSTALSQTGYGRYDLPKHATTPTLKTRGGDVRHRALTWRRGQNQPEPSPRTQPNSSKQATQAQQEHEQERTTNTAEGNTTRTQHPTSRHEHTNTRTRPSPKAQGQGEPAKKPNTESPPPGDHRDRTRNGRRGGKRRRGGSATDPTRCQKHRLMPRQSAAKMK